ncbi:MAG: T9SS type A sorting domain-containing protein, partial [Chitinophagales bacterium]|nr:T9SS type A sorting domain-containing protein [Chitinophagales bacterium]
YDLINVGAGNKKKSPTGTTSGGEYYGIMHNKFVVIDAISTDPNDAWVIAGSANMTDAQIHIDYQNVIVIQDQSLARAYKLEFEEMFSGKFGPEKTNNTPHEFIIGGKRMELYFSPSDDTETQIIKQINSANHDLYFAIFTFTRFGISYAIEDMVETGIFAAGMYDETDATDSTAVTILEGALGETFFQQSGSTLLHHKYLIVDPNCPEADALVLSGSHNWSSSANSRNDENTLIIHDSTTANIYYQEWVQRYEENGGTQFVSEAACEFVGVQPEIQINKSIKVYPNPANNYLWIESENNFDGIAEIMNMHGEIIYATGVHAQMQMMDINNLDAGMYILVIKNKDQIFTNKFVKE